MGFFSQSLGSNRQSLKYEHWYLRYIDKHNRQSLVHKFTNCVTLHGVVVSLLKLKLLRANMVTLYFDKQSQHGGRIRRIG